MGLHPGRRTRRVRDFAPTQPKWTLGTIFKTFTGREWFPYCRSVKEHLQGISSSEQHALKESNDGMVAPIRGSAQPMHAPIVRTFYQQLR
jgi:hypothetical protein